MCRRHHGWECRLLMLQVTCSDMDDHSLEQSCQVCKQLSAPLACATDVCIENSTLCGYPQTVLATLPCATDICVHCWVFCMDIPGQVRRQLFAPLTCQEHHMQRSAQQTIDCHQPVGCKIDNQNSMPGALPNPPEPLTSPALQVFESAVPQHC